MRRSQMPAKSEKQARLMRAAAHGATFQKAKQIRQSMTPQQMRDFSHTAPKKGTYGGVVASRKGR